MLIRDRAEKGGGGCLGVSVPTLLYGGGGGNQFESINSYIEQYKIIYHQKNFLHIWCTLWHRECCATVHAVALSIIKQTDKKNQNTDKLQCNANNNCLRINQG